MTIKALLKNQVLVTVVLGVVFAALLAFGLVASAKAKACHKALDAADTVMDLSAESFDYISQAATTGTLGSEFNSWADLMHALDAAEKDYDKTRDSCRK